MIVCSNSSLKAVKRFKKLGTVELSIPKDINPQDNFPDRDNPAPIELWNSTLQQSFPLISPAIFKWALDIFRHFWLRWWRIRIRQEFVIWYFKMWSVPSIPISQEKKGETSMFNWRTKYTKGWLLSRSSAESTRDWEEGRDCLARCIGIDPPKMWVNLWRADKSACRNSTFQRFSSASIPRGWWLW